MAHKHRVAVARIFSDLIKADRIIDTGEISFWLEMCQKHDIDEKVKADATNISLAEAIETLRDADDEKLRRHVLEDCRKMTTSDGFCASTEALLMITLSKMLDDNTEEQCEVLSIKRSSFEIDVATALYIENSFDSEVNEVIAERYRSIFRELQFAGFNFIYIPKIIEHYRQTDSKMFLEILRFLAPTKKADQLETIYEDIIGMTTDKFCRDIMINRCNMTELRGITQPSLLIKVSNSYVGDVPYANYLQIPVDDEIVATVENFVDRFTGMLSSDIYVIKTAEESNNQYHYHGFYKQLLEKFLTTSNINSIIEINPKSRKEMIKFKDIDKYLNNINRRERALYIALLCQEGGIDFSRPTSGPQLRTYNQRMDRFRRRYNAIYDMIGGSGSTPPDPIDAQSRSQMVSRIRKVVGSLTQLQNPENYTITRRANGPDAGKLFIDIDRSQVLVNEGKGNPTPLMKSHLYNTFKAIQ